MAWDCYCGQSFEDPDDRTRHAPTCAAYLAKNPYTRSQVERCDVHGGDVNSCLISALVSRIISARGHLENGRFAEALEELERACRHAEYGPHDT